MTASPPAAAVICTLQSRHPRARRLRQSTAPPSPRDAARASVDGTCPHGAAVSRGSTALWSWQQNPRRHRPGMRKAPRASDAPEPVAGAVRPIAAEPPAQRLSVTQRPRLRCGRKEAERKRGRGRAAGRRRVGRVPDVKAPPWPRPAAVGGAGACERLGPRGPGPLCGRAAGGATRQGRGRTGQRGALGIPRPAAQQGCWCPLRAVSRPPVSGPRFPVWRMGAGWHLPELGGCVAEGAAAWPPCGCPLCPWARRVLPEAVCSLPATATLSLATHPPKAGECHLCHPLGSACRLQRTAGREQGRAARWEAGREGPASAPGAQPGGAACRGADQ